MLLESAGPKTLNDSMTRAEVVSSTSEDPELRSIQTEGSPEIDRSFVDLYVIE